MRTLHFGLRVADIDASLAFYSAVGYGVVGQVPGTSLGDLTMIKLPGDPFVAIELVSGGDAPCGGALTHFVITVESMRDALATLAADGVEPEGPPTSPDDTDDFLTAWIVDPDGNRIELVQWPPGHADGITSADWRA